MPPQHKAQWGSLYEQATQYAQDLEAGQAHAADQLVAAWTQGYWRIRADIDALTAKIAAAKAQGTPMSAAWGYQADRLKQVLATTKTEMAKYAQFATGVTTAQQQAAIAAALKHAEKLGKAAVAEALPGLTASFAQVNPKVLEAGVGFLSDGTPLADLLTTTMPAQAAENVRSALIQGLATGASQDVMVRLATQALGVSHTRAVTIMRTESLRAYRHATRSTYLANQHLLEGWVWHANLDARCCVACVLMDGTVHPVDAILDGHPRCRCAMLPRTKTWQQITGQDLPDTRPPLRSGKQWLEAQPPHVQRALMGPAKFTAWTDGQITLDDMVGRTYDPKWGTMRSERSLLAIQEDRNGNWFDTAATPGPAATPPPPKPNWAHVKDLAAEHDLPALQEWAADPGDTGPQGLADLHAAIAYKLNRGPELGPLLPRPDPAKVDAAVAKLRKAVFDKGFPSKGYSQVKAIYKAQANAEVGTQVGVVKALTWQQKITAAKVLEVHDAALPDILAEYRAQQVIAKAHGEALAIHAQKEAEALAAKIAQETQDAAQKAQQAIYQATSHPQAVQALQGLYDDAWTAYTAAEPGPASDLALARVDGIATKQEEYADARAFMQSQQGTWSTQGQAWAQGQPMAMQVDDTGWAHFQANGIDLHLNPIAAKSTVFNPDKPWAQVFEPDPAAVDKAVKALTDEHGYLMATAVQQLEDQVAAGTFTGQTAANLTEAIAKAKATVPLKPEADKVANMIQALDQGLYSPEELVNLAKVGPAQGQANVQEAVAQWQAQQAAKAVVPPKPVIDPGKFDWAKASDKQVAKIKAKVDSGEWTLDDVYALYQKSKNSGPKTNYAKAILDLEGKPVQVPTPAAPPPTPTPPQPAWSSTPPFRPEDLTFTGKTLGTHGAQVWKDADGTSWLFKPPKDPGDGFLATLDEAGSRLQAQAGLKAPDTYVVTLGGKRGSIQRMFPAQDAFGGGFRPEDLSEMDLAQVQRQHVLDWLLSNHDGHRDQFLRLADGQLVGIDKGQAFRWFGQDRLDWGFHPNAAYGAPEPVYNTLWRAFAQGKNVELTGPDTGALADAIRDVQAISDADLKAALRPYAEQAAARGKLCLPQPSFPGVVKATVPANDVEAFLDAVVARKHALADDFQALYDRAAAARAQAIPGWKPTAPAKPASRWFGKAKPEPPTAPTAPQAETQPMFDTWLKAVKDKYHAYSGKDLEASNNWQRVRKVIDDLNRSAVQELKDRHYLDDALAQQALDLIDAAEARRKTLEAAYKRALADHADALAKYKADLAAWKDANGIKDLTQGMDDGVIRHSSDQAGVSWAHTHFSETRYSATQRKWLKSYTGSSYDTWNGHLRATQGQPTQYLDVFKHLDAAMEAQPIPEDVILHRGTNNITIGDQVISGYSDDLTQWIGSVTVDHGYISTSVGNSAAFSSNAIQLKIRTPAGTPGAYVQMFSNYSSERELILGRDTRMFIHNAYRQNGRWVLEVEVVPADFDPVNATPSPSANPWSH